MKEHKIVEDGFKWVSPEKRTSRFGGQASPRKQEIRTPLYWLARDGNELYLVNESEETLDIVTTHTGETQTIDNEAITLSSEDEYIYKNVKPNFAVKIDVYDGFYDLDYLLQVIIIIQSKSLGKIRVMTLPQKGGVDEMVLIWNNYNVGKKVSEIHSI